MYASQTLVASTYVFKHAAQFPKPMEAGGDDVCNHVGHQQGSE